MSFQAWNATALLQLLGGVRQDLAQCIGGQALACLTVGCRGGRCCRQGFWRGKELKLRHQFLTASVGIQDLSEEPAKGIRLIE